MSYEYQVDIGGVMYGMKDIQSVNITQPLFDRLSAGNCCSAELTMSFWMKQDPPRMGKIVPYIRESGKEDWQQLGVYYIDTRVQKKGLLSIVAYDTMLKAEAPWPEGKDLFPMTMRDAANIIAEAMGTTLDERTTIDNTFSIPSKPSEADSMRNVLAYIASANLGNWIVTNEAKLLLVPLFDSMPEETNYLVTEEGEAILFGDTRILV